MEQTLKQNTVYWHKHKSVNVNKVNKYTDPNLDRRRTGEKWDNGEKEKRRNKT